MRDAGRGEPLRPAFFLRNSAEDEGFEPSRACAQHAFQACALGH